MCVIPGAENEQQTFRKDENGIVLGIGYVFLEPVVRGRRGEGGEKEGEMKRLGKHW